jgi:DNA-binding transcriptional MerR regulator
MTIDSKDMLKSILDSLSRIDYIKPEDIPNIDLYMDQVTTFMDSHLASSKRRPEDKILTKTMINNYAKNNLLPPPKKKKYSKEHLLMMIFIYYFKGILSITDIQALLEPLTEKYFQNDETLNIEAIYSEVFSLEQSQVDKLAKDITDKFNISRRTFENAGEDQKFLQLFSFICQLSFDVYVKKQLIEKLIDQLPEL